MLLALFGFMDLLIIQKWLTDFSQMQDAKPPSIITTMITMVLGFGEQADPKLRETPLLTSQTLIMRVMLVTAIICAPIMLLVKPLHLRKLM